jgi:NodT family efflux transporter outer membrane factor (OMF) lipoprotein
MHRTDAEAVAFETSGNFSQEKRRGQINLQFYRLIFPLTKKTLEFGLMCIQGLCLLALFSCAAGPDFRKPEAKVPLTWDGLNASVPSQGTNISPQPVELIEWWNSFNDPVLTSLIERAIGSNLDLRQAGARIRQARASAGVAAAGFWPEVDANSSFLRSGSGGTSVSSSNGSGTSGTQTPTIIGSSVGNLFQAGLDASWELDFFGGTRRNIEATRADLQAAVEDRRNVLVTLVSDVGNTYANLRQFQKQIEIARNNLKAQQHTVEITRKRHEAGFVGGLDVANALAQAATTESQIPVLETSVKSAIYSLSILLGLEPAALEGELSTERPIPPTPPEVPVGLPSDLLRRRPDIRKAEAQLHAATARIGVATADLFPKFSLTGSFGFSSSDVTVLGNWSSRVWTWGPSVTWPVFDAGRIRWNIQVQNALQEQALLTYEQAILTALKDVDTALVSYAKELQHNRLLATAVQNNRTAVDLSTKLYVEGKTDFLNVLNAQRSLYTSEDALAQSTNSLTTDLIALYKALGGGWEKSAGEDKPEGRN